MSIYDKVYKAYTDSIKNRFFDAWGIVASPKTIDDLKGECLERITLFHAEQGTLEEIFGLVIIPHNLVDRDKVYIVDEQLGRAIIGQLARRVSDEV